jgi:CRP/FNR family cyclic AMP-dependent transcriptional regulator
MAATFRSDGRRAPRLPDRLFESVAGGGHEAIGAASRRFPRNTNVYNAGDRADRVFFVETGRVKLVMLSPAGKECLLAFHGPGHVFGELSLRRPEARRLETATATEETRLRSLPSRRFLAILGRQGLLEGFVECLVGRIARQQQMITDLVTADSEHRLGETLLMLARTIGTSDPPSTRIDSRISHEELSQMVGTTRPRVTEFMSRFRALGLIQVTRERHLIVRQARLAAHIAGLG